MENQWELDKENVQHSKAGRSVEQLNITLAQSHSEDHQKYLKCKRQELELAIRSYSGDDPLQPYIEYVTWTEENYPSGGKGSQLYDLLKKCIKAFAQDKRYHQDVRYINIFIAFAELEESKAAFSYDFMFHRGIGTMVAYFWYSYALALERKGDMKSAGDKYEHGIRCRAQPLNFLTEKFELFKRRLGYQAGLQSIMLDPNETQMRPVGISTIVADSDQPPPGNSRTRKALAALKTSAGGRAPVMRVGSALSRDQSGLDSNQQQQPQSMRSGASAAGSFVVPSSAGVYDENTSRHLPQPRAAAAAQFEAVADGHKENVAEPRPWNERGGLDSRRGRGAAAAAASASATSAAPASLQVHEEEVVSATAPTPVSALKRGLSECAARRPRLDEPLEMLTAGPAALFGAEPHHPQQHKLQHQQQQNLAQLPGPAGPKEVFMCQVDRLYMGLQEVSFEELRAAVRHPGAIPSRPHPSAAQSKQLQQQQQQEQLLQQLQRQVSELTESLRESGDRCRRLEASNDSLVRYREQLERRVDELQHQLAVAAEEAARMRTERDALAAKLGDYEANIRVIYQERTEVAEMKGRLNAELLRVEREREDLEQRLAEHKERERQQQQQQHQSAADTQTPMRAGARPPLSAPSPTVNTKEAFAQLQSLFRDAPRGGGGGCREESMMIDTEGDEFLAAGPQTQQPPPPPLANAKAATPAPASAAKAAVGPYAVQPPTQPHQQQKPATFEIFCDESILQQDRAKYYFWLI